MAGIRIDELSPSLLPSLEHEFPAMKDGLSVKLTVAQVIALATGTLEPEIEKCLRYVRALGATEDLNLIKEPGIYTQNQNAGASGGANYPEALAGMLVVLSGSGATNVRTIQLYISRTDPPRFHCRMESSADTWLGWADAVASTRTLSTQHSLQGGGDLTINRTLSLVGDKASPGANKSYGTDASGARGWYDIPSAVKAWVNFNGTGSVTINGSANVTSITDNGTGDFTLNFGTPLVDAKYAVIGSAKRGGQEESLTMYQHTLAAGSARVVFGAGSFNPSDPDKAHIAVFR